MLKFGLKRTSTTLEVDGRDRVESGKESSGQGREAHVEIF